MVVWDLETVPDLAAAARMLDLGAAPEAKVREALGSGFPKHPLHKIHCARSNAIAGDLETGSGARPGHSAYNAIVDRCRTLMEPL